MRLLRLRIKNLASLKGEHLIDFKQIQGISPLFAITGETGAGKSTILNAIALVLYGRVYKTTINQSDLVTLGEKEGEAQLLFQLGGKNYLAEWRAKIRNQRTGEFLKKPEISRYIYPLEGDEFHSPRQSPIESVESLLRLDFDQFCKCIILNQGEFARFLSSSFAERKEILEKLYPGELLEGLNRELKVELDAYKKEKNDLEIELETLRGDGVDGAQLSLSKDQLAHQLKVHEAWSLRLETLDFHFISLMDYHKKFNDNKKKSDSVITELMEKTTAYNIVLKVSQELTDAYLQAQSRQEKELPHLQELLQSEEMLRQWIENQALFADRLTKNQKEKETLTGRLAQTSQKLAESNSIKEVSAKSLKRPASELKLHRKRLESFSDLFHEQELMAQQGQEKEKALKTHEELGKTLGAEFKKLTLELSLFPVELAKTLQELEQKKKKNQLAHDERYKVQFQKQELADQLKLLTEEQQLLKRQAEDLSAKLLLLKNELTPIETTLRLQSLLSAVETCVTHSESMASPNCPVCHSPVQEASWQELKNSLDQTDFAGLRKRQEELVRSVLTSEEEIKHLKSRDMSLQEKISKKTPELSRLILLCETKIESLEELEEAVAGLQKQVWDQEALKKEEKRINLELQRVREQYVGLRDEVHLNQSQLAKHLQHMIENKSGFSNLVEDLSKETFLELKNDLRLLAVYLEHETHAERILQEKTHLTSNFESLHLESQKMSQEKASLDEKIHTLKLKLEAQLQGKSATDLIQDLDKQVREFRDKWALKEKETKTFELSLKGLQSSIITLDEHIKEIDLQYSKELHQVRELGKAELPELKNDLTLLMQRLSNFALDTKSAADLFIPFKEVLAQEKASFKNHTNSLRMDYASMSTRLSEWERKLDRISLMELKRNELKGKLDRLDRLDNVLGKDELRTFVLSLVEENLILQTNEELQKLCLGRYEIIHQRRLEFWILDKFREGQMRKVSTLSGGETFMVSLAMALALAEMTRGQAEIDTLFIDEGFGTLDQESLEDVLDMLQQIQTRGLMVGIISHIKALTQSLPVNLMVNKKSDGTSSLSLRFN